MLSATKNRFADRIAASVEESEKDKGGDYTLNDNVLIEIGAAFIRSLDSFT